MMTPSNMTRKFQNAKTTTTITTTTTKQGLLNVCAVSVVGGPCWRSNLCLFTLC